MAMTEVVPVFIFCVLLLLVPLIAALLYIKKSGQKQKKKKSNLYCVLAMMIPGYALGVGIAPVISALFGVEVTGVWNLFCRAVLLAISALIGYCIGKL